MNVLCRMQAASINAKTQMVATCVNATKVFFLDGNARTCSGKFYFETKKHIGKLLLHQSLFESLSEKNINSTMKLL